MLFLNRGIGILLMLMLIPTFACAEESTDNSIVGTKVIGTGASIVNSDQSTAVGLSIQIVNGSGNELSGFGALAIEGEGNTAIGVNSQVFDGIQNKAIGFGAQAGGGDYNTAIGRNTHAIYGDGNTAVGAGSYAGGTNDPKSHLNTAIGFGAQSTVGNSVALGAYSVASEPDTVSVGQPGYERRIMNVAPGYYGTDAVNMSQLWTLDSKVNRVGAMSFAMSALAPLPYDPKDPTQYSAGIGTYNGQSAVAFGIYHYTKPTVMLNAAVAMSDDRWEKSARMGITWRTGGPKPKALIPASASIDRTTSETASPDSGIMARVNKILAEE